MTRTAHRRSNGAPGNCSLPFFRISGVTGAGLPPLLEAIWRELAAARAADAAEALRASQADDVPPYFPE